MSTSEFDSPQTTPDGIQVVYDETVIQFIQVSHLQTAASEELKDNISGKWFWMLASYVLN